MHTAISITDGDYVAGIRTLTFTMENEGATTLDIRLLEFVVDGAWATDKVQSGWTVESVSTNWWTPQSTLTISLYPFDPPTPKDAVVTTEHGARAYWRI